MPSIGKSFPGTQEALVACRETATPPRRMVAGGSLCLVVENEPNEVQQELCGQDLGAF